MYRRTPYPHQRLWTITYPLLENSTLRKPTQTRKWWCCRKANSGYVITNNCQTHRWNVGSCHIIIKYPQQQLPRAWGSCPTANLRTKCLHRLLGSWQLPSAFFRHGLADGWVWKMKQKAGKAGLRAWKIPTVLQKCEIAQLIKIHRNTFSCSFC